MTNHDHRSFDSITPEARKIATARSQAGAGVHSFPDADRLARLIEQSGKTADEVRKETGIYARGFKSALAGGNVGRETREKLNLWMWKQERQGR